MILAKVPDPVAASRAVHKLEEAIMVANSGIAHYDEEEKR